jgi:uncharacterized protein involved in response to NO
MGRNLYILSATFAVIAAITFVLSITHFGQEPGSPGDASLWRVTSIAFLCLGLVAALAGVMSSLFEQAERRHEEERRRARASRRSE